MRQERVSKDCSAVSGKVGMLRGLLGKVRDVAASQGWSSGDTWWPRHKIRSHQ